MAFKIKIEPEAHQDIQQGIDWYNEQQSGLGRKFHAEVKASIVTDAYIFQHKPSVIPRYHPFY